MRNASYSSGPISSHFNAKAPGRNPKLQAVLRNARLITPPVIALRIVNAASNPDCSPKEIAELLKQDPVLCAKILKAVNSCVFGTGGQPVASVDRAVILLGLNQLRSLVLGLSLPVAQLRSDGNRSNRDIWIGSVSGAILAKELSALDGGAATGHDLVAGLLRDLGMLLMVQAVPGGWEQLQHIPIESYLQDPCGAEDRIFGVNHVEVTTELLSDWKIPAEVLEPIRYHHEPERLSRGPRSLYQRASLLNFVEMLVRLDQVAESSRLLGRLLARAESQFGLTKDRLVQFLEGVAPKIADFTKLLDLDVTDTPHYAEILGRGCDAFHSLTMVGQSALPAASRESVVDMAETQLPAPKRKTEFVNASAANRKPAAPLPPFRSEMINRFPTGGCALEEYELRTQLGRGAMGVVFGGFDPALGREVAIKLLSPEFCASSEARMRFTREAQTLAAIHHENVIGVFDVGEADGLPFMVMEYVRGGTLEDLLESVGPLSHRQIVDMGSQLARGLAAAHAKGIIHRDIKPANILIEELTGRVKLGDFGLARGIDHMQLTQAGALVGSPLYMSPELIEGLPFDHRTDLFSLGGVFYQMCTGKLPFQAPNIGSLLRAIGEANPVPPSEHRPDLDPRLNSVVLDLLRKNPVDRIASGEQLFGRLAAIR